MTFREPAPGRLALTADDLAAARHAADRPLRLAFQRRDHHAALIQLEPACHAAIRGLSAPGLDDDDLLQVARLGVLKALGTYTGDRRNLGHVIGYCCLVSRRHALQAVRDARAHCRHSDAVVSLEDRQHDGAARGDMIGGADGDLHAAGRAFNEPHDRAEHNELLRLAAHVLGSLPARQAEAVRLVAIDGLTYAEAADRCGVARKTVDVDLWRAWQALRVRATGKPRDPSRAPLLRCGGSLVDRIRDASFTGCRNSSHGAPSKLRPSRPVGPRHQPHC